jgi:aminoglycoside phosphotransferase (APT) family kinase protein
MSTSERAAHDDTETIAVRPGEELDVPRLTAYLHEHLEGAEGPLEIRQFGGGHANLTYELRFGQRAFVLRRPPLGPVAAGAHDMKREHQVLSVLYRAFALAPRSFLLCTDHSVIGSDFVVEERRVGTVIRRALPPQAQADLALQRRIGEMMVDTLAAFHAVDPASVGLDTLGKADGYLARQLSGWTKRWNAAMLEDTRPATAVATWLEARLPISPIATLVHNDFKLDNILVSNDDLATPVAVLDWDMCTVGDPLCDVGYLLGLWDEAADAADWRVFWMPTPAPGFPTRNEIVARYAEKTGRDLAAIEWYHAFNVFRYGVIAQQIYVRYARGQTSDERFKDFGYHADRMIVKAAKICGIDPDPKPTAPAAA